MIRNHQTPLNFFENPIPRLALLYGCLGAVWIFCSESILDTFSFFGASRELLETLKGLLFISLSSVFLYWYGSRQFRNIQVLQIEKLTLAEALKQHLELLETFSEKLPSLVYVRNFEQEIVFCNLAFCQLFGVDASGFRSPEPRKNLAVFDDFRQNDRCVLDSGISCATEVEYQIDGARRRYSVLRFPLFLDNHERCSVGVILTDVTEAAEKTEKIYELNQSLEETVLARTQHLEAVAKELESFCYAVSHDLRAPLRHISSFGQILLADEAPRLTADGKQLLSRVIHAASRMDQQIDSLLELSVVSRVSVDVIDGCDLSAIANSITEMYSAADPSRHVTVSIQPGLVVSTDPKLARVILENLFDNAWKYTSKVAQASIEFGKSGDDFYVRDNGAGFDMAYSGKLFTAFQRLHLDREFPGLGIGLATVHRVITRLGGSIRVESSVGVGTTFYFVL